MALVLALLSGCVNPQRTRGTFEIIEIRLTGDVVIGFTWKDATDALCRRFAIFREGDRLSMAFDDGVIIDSRYTLAEVVPDRVLPFRMWACPTDNTWGSKGCPGPGWTRTLYAVGEVTLETDSRWRWTVRLPSTPPKTRDLCRRHGGSRPEFEKPRPPPPPATEEELAWILHQATYDWGSRNPKVRLRARESYRLLIEDYRDSMTVLRNLSRIAERADAELEE